MQESDPPNPEPAPFWNQKRIRLYILMAALLAVLVVVVVFSLAAPGFSRISDRYMYTVVPYL